MDKREALKIVKQAKELLEPIPSKEWIVGDFSDEESRCCGIGHYERLTSDDPSDYSYENCHDIWSSKFRFATEIFNIDIADVNNGDTFYHGKTKDFLKWKRPKTRVMKALEWIIEQEEKDGNSN